MYFAIYPCFCITWAQFHRAVSKAQKFAKHEISSLIKTGLPTKFPFVAYCLFLVFSCCLFILKIWLVILFLSRKKFHAKQIFVLSSSMKFGPVLNGIAASHASHVAMGFCYYYLLSLYNIGCSLSPRFHPWNLYRSHTRCSLYLPYLFCHLLLIWNLQVHTPHSASFMSYR